MQDKNRQTAEAVTGQPDQQLDQTEVMVADSSSYELLKKRLIDQGSALQQKVHLLNEGRLEAFGRSEQALLLRIQARTENNCIARDIVRVGDLLLLGYNVFIGLRKETAVSDVFALYHLSQQGEEGELVPVSLSGSFLDEPRFIADFRELHAYYKQAELIQLRVHQEKLLAAFQIGQQVHDIRVFRWNIGANGSLSYIDNRGERDIALPPTHDFEWVATTRAQHVGGKHPHVNILDTVFVEAVGGDLTVKIENNTETGLGIYSEPVEDKNQSLADAEIAYAQLGTLILLRIRPYREQIFRYLVFNQRTQKVVRLDAIGVSCVQLPEDHGIIFPGGYYLQSGEYKRFELPGATGEHLRFKRMLRSPNGEDVLYVFYQPGAGFYGLFTYNLIEKTLGTPIVTNGYARFDDGRMLVFQAGTEPARIHPMQLWQTPFSTEEHARTQVAGRGFWGKIGNAELVRGVSDLIGIARAVREQVPTRQAYEDIVRQCGRVSDAHFWLQDAEVFNLAADLAAIREGALTTLDEFEKVASIRRETAQALLQAEQTQQALLTDIASMLWHRPDDFIHVLQRIRMQRGQLFTLRSLRYIDLGKIEALDAHLDEEQVRVGERALAFLGGETAFDSYRRELEALGTALEKATNSNELGALLDQLDTVAQGLDLLTEQLGSLPGSDAVLRTRILDEIGLIYADVNRLRAAVRNQRRASGIQEATAEFGAQIKLFAQAVENALGLADTPAKCDDALTRLLGQLEELEGRFAEHDGFLTELVARREAVYEALSARRQSLVDAQQRRIQSLLEAGGRILDGVPRRAGQLADMAAIHAYFAADPLIAKLRRITDDLRTLEAGVAADDLDTRLNTIRDQTLRMVRDRVDLSGEGGDTLRLGSHVFTVSRQTLDLTLIPRTEGMSFHLTGTDYFADVANTELDELQPFWEQALVSETPQLYRSTYLAGCILQSVLTKSEPLSLAGLSSLVSEDGGIQKLEVLVRDYAATRYQEGYQKGVHDTDAVRILLILADMQAQAGLLSYSPVERALARLFWSFGCQDDVCTALRRQACAAQRLREELGARATFERLVEKVAADIEPFAAQFRLEHADGRRAAAYLIEQLAAPSAGDSWCVSGSGEDLAVSLVRHLERNGRLKVWREDMDGAEPAERWQLACDWLHAFESGLPERAAAWLEDAAAILCMPALRHERVNIELERTVEGLLGEHPLIVNGGLTLNLHDFWSRFHTHQTVVVPAFERLQHLRHALVEQEKKHLHLEQFQARPLSTFVRNRLIDEVYLPLVGENLAKQIGTAGQKSRTDRMGMLLLISPPGYGKTTLMEYVADRLGLIFVRINCPVLGHDVVSLDPERAGQSAARQELEKLNLGLMMGNNVMLYLDDIQHTNPEFLQKFIALADGTRRIEGVWNGEARSFDMRGKRFAIVMAGNPYTESGDVFKIPDMLANRADIYNLGDVLSGHEKLFALSYIENCLTANSVLQPLAARDPKDVHLLVRMAEGEDIAASTLAHGYSRVEIDEIVALLKRLFKVRDLLLKVNLAYIESAAQQDIYRTEPPFRLQGSYRNMTRLAARIAPTIREEELDALLRDHYRGEAQTLTTGAEENLLKLALMLGRPVPDEVARWEAICAEFIRQRKLGGADGDGSVRIATALLDIGRAVEGLRDNDGVEQTLREQLDMLITALRTLNPHIEVAAPDMVSVNTSLMAMHEAYEKALLPLVTATYRKMRLDHSMWDEMKRISSQISKLESLLPEEQGGRGKGAGD